MPAAEKDAKAVSAHLDEWAEAGWELVAANAIQCLSISTANGATYSNSAMRHYFYWKKERRDAGDRSQEGGGTVSA